MRKVATAVFVLILSGLGTMAATEGNYRTKVLFGFLLPRQCSGTADMHFLLFLRTWEHYSSLTPYCSRDGIFIEAARG